MITLPLRERMLSLIGGAMTVVAAARRRTPRALPSAPPVKVNPWPNGIDQRRTVLIQRPRHELYRVLRDLELLPRFLDHLAGVTAEDDRTFRFLVRDGDRELRWRARITEDVPGNCLAWESLPGGDLIAGGSIALHDGRRGGTVVDIDLWYRPAEHHGLNPAVVTLFERFTGRRMSASLLELRHVIEGVVLPLPAIAPIVELPAVDQATA